MIPESSLFEEIALSWPWHFWQFAMVCHWAWLRRGYWRYRSLIDWLMSLSIRQVGMTLAGLLRVIEINVFTSGLLCVYVPSRFWMTYTVYCCTSLSKDALQSRIECQTDWYNISWNSLGVCMRRDSRGESSRGGVPPPPLTFLWKKTATERSNSNGTEHGFSSLLSVQYLQYPQL